MRLVPSAGNLSVRARTSRRQTPARNRSIRTAILAAFALAVSAAACTSSTAKSAPVTTTTAQVRAASASASDGNDVLSQIQTRYETIIRDALPTVVLITNSSGLGSGVVYDTQGDIVTNNHVVGNDTTFKVTLSTGSQTVDASLVGTFAPNDLAVIRLKNPPQGLKTAHLGDSSKLQVGDIVFAMGNPLGLSSSVTEGIVSALGRTVDEPQSGSSTPAVIPSAVQTSASINPGNSGGALVNLTGDVVGIPTLAAIDPEIGNGSAAPGIGFAIPANTVKNIADQLIKDGKVTNSGRASLGVGVLSVSDPSGGPVGAGIVQLAPGGPAEKAGLKVGDIIVAIDDKKVTSANVLMDILAQLKPGQDVNVTVMGQDGKQRTVKVTLGELPG